MKKEVKRRRNPNQRLKPVPTNCPFCRAKLNPDYKNFNELGGYVTDRAKIIGKARSGVCSKHQRRLSRAIKRARHLGLLPFTGGLQ